jgi:hypothetical protein
LRFKMKNKLKKDDYVRLTEFLSENTNASVGLFQGIDLEFMLVNPLVVAVEGFGYSINGDVSFQQPIGLEVNENLRLDDEIGISVLVNYGNIKLSKVVTEASELESDLSKCLKILEKIVNQTCNMLDTLVEQTSTINSEWLDRQLEMMLGKEELEKRGETAKPFGTIHAKGWKDAKERAGNNLVPVYMERDKTYLYEGNKIFIYLPRNFVMKLLKIESRTMIPADHFTDKEREVLKKFSMRQYVKTRSITGKICYYDLNEKTRSLLLKGMKKR